MKKEQISKDNRDKYYDLKTEAIEELASALKQDPNEVKTETEKPPQDPYKIDWLARIPTWIKALFVKYWVAGVICYFGFWGLGLFFRDELDKIVFVGFLTGAVTDLLVNTGFLYLETDKKEYHKYMMLPVVSKKLWSFFVNVLYGIAISFAVFQIYAQINILMVRVKDLPEGTIWLPVEPLLYGLFFLMVDMFFISIKNLVVWIANRQKTNKQI